MKTLLLIVGILVCAFSAKAQAVTNVDIRVTTTVVVTGVSTNQSQSTLSLSATGGKKDQNRIAGWIYAFNAYRAGGGVLAFDAWIKQDIADRADSYAAAKSQVDNAVLAQKLQYLLANPDLLSGSDLSSLTTIAAKAP